MKLEVTSRGHQLSEFLQDYIEKRVGRLDKYTYGDAEAHVILERGQNGQIVEINVHAFHKVMHAKEEGEHVRDCIDKAISKLESQLRKQKEKTKERRQ